MTFVDACTSHGRKGQPRMKAVCDDCGREEVFPCAKGDIGQAKRKITNLGWAIVANKLRCPSCEAARKAGGSMKTASLKPIAKGAADAPLRRPTREQIREINAALSDYYDLEAQRYRGGETDNTIAELLEVRPGWVTEERERAFGPAGGNEELEKALTEVGRLLAESKELMEANERLKKLGADLQKDLKEVRAQLQKVSMAVGEHVMARAGK